MRALLFILFCNLASAKIPADLIGPRDLIPQILSGFNNYLYTLEMNSIVTQSDRCKVFEGKVRFTMCISRTNAKEIIQESVLYYVNNELKATTIFVQHGTTLSPTPNHDLYNFNFPIQDNASFAQIEILDPAITIVFNRKGLAEKAKMDAEGGNFRLSISDTFIEDQTLRQYEIDCGHCQDLSMTVIDGLSSIRYQKANRSDITPLEFKKFYNMLYGDVYGQFSTGILDHAKSSLGFPDFK